MSWHEPGDDVGHPYSPVVLSAAKDQRSEASLLSMVC